MSAGSDGADRSEHVFALDQSRYTSRDVRSGRNGNGTGHGGMMNQSMSSLFSSQSGTASDNDLYANGDTTYNTYETNAIDDHDESNARGGGKRGEATNEDEYTNTEFEESAHESEQSTPVMMRSLDKRGGPTPGSMGKSNGIDAVGIDRDGAGTPSPMERRDGRQM